VPVKDSSLFTGVLGSGHDSPLLDSALLPHYAWPSGSMKTRLVLTSQTRNKFNNRAEILFQIGDQTENSET